MFRKLLLVVLLLVILPSLAMAQSGKLRGTVTDKETNDPLIGVNITLEGTSLGAATDINGEYVVLGVPPGVYTVRSSYISYQEQAISNIRVSAALTTTLDFHLQPSTIEMAALEVVAERPLVQRNTTNTVRMTTSEDIENLPIRGVQNIIALNAGVVQQDGELYIRGGRQDEVLFFIDGVSATNPNFNNENVSVIQEAIEEIQMQAGGFTAEFGGSNSGIVATQMKSGGARLNATLDYRTDDFAKAGEEFLGTTSRGIRNAVATVGGPIGSKLRFFVAGQHNYARNRTAQFIEPFNFSGDPRFVDDGLSGRSVGDALPSAVAFKKNFLPNNTLNDNKVQGTLSYNFSNAIKFRLSGSFQHVSEPNNFNTFYLAMNNVLRTDPYSEGNTDYGLAGVKMTHLVNPTTFYEVNVNWTGRYDKTTDPIFVDDWQSYASRDAWAAAGRDTTGWLGAFQGPLDYSTINRFLLNAPNEFQNSYNKNSQTSLGVSAAFSSQLNKNIELKVGGRYDRWTMRDFNVGSVSGFLTHLYGSDGNTERTFEDPLGVYDSEYIRRVELSRLGQINNQGWDYLGNEKINDGVQGPRRPVFGSAYVQSKFEYRDLILNLGLRYERLAINAYAPDDLENPTRDSENEWIDESAVTTIDPYEYLLPRVNFAFPVTDNTVFYAQYGKYVQQPRLDAIYTSVRNFRAVFPEVRTGYGGAATWLAKPERTNQYELGLRNTLTSDFAFTLSVFYKDLLDQLRREPVFADGTGEIAEGTRYVGKLGNGDFGTTKGLEATLELRRTKRLASRVNYTLSSAKGTGSSQAGLNHLTSDVTLARYPALVYLLDQNQTHRGTVMMDYRFARGDGGSVLQGFGINALLTFNSGHQYTKINEPRNLGQANPWNVGVRATQDPRFRNPIEPVNSSTTPWNFNVDLNIDKMFYFNTFNIRLYGNVLNALNTRNIINVYQQTGVDDDDGWLKNPLAGQFLEIPGYEDLYRAANLENGWSHRLATGNELWGSPRQIIFGMMIQFQ